MDRFDIQKLRELPIEGVAERLGLRVQKHKALCPFHQDSHPSLTFRLSSNTFHCFVCGAQGGTIDLAMHILGYSFIDACKWLANEHNVILTEWQSAQKQKPQKQYPPDVKYLSALVRQPVLTIDAQRFLFDERKIDTRVVHWLGISSTSLPTPCWKYGKPFYDAPSLLFPYRDVEGNVLNVQSRYLGKDKSIPRFRFPSNSQCHIFNLPILRYLKPDEPLYISEGITDCMALLSTGHKAIAIPSATLLNESDMQLLKQYGALNLRIYPDKDAAGLRLYHHLLNVTASIGACLYKLDLPDGFKDYGEYWAALNS